MTVSKALKLAITAAPTDLVRRVNYINARYDSCDVEDMEIWRLVLEITLNGGGGS